MKRDDDGLPVTGIQSKELGVRVPPNEYADIDVSEDGFVELNRRGMSVASHCRYLPPHLIPRRYKDVVPGARGANSLSIFCFGEGEFIDSQIDEKLSLAVKADSTQRGNVVPNVTMQVDEFFGHIAATRDQWIGYEPE